MKPVLLTGATGFVGGRLLRLLEDEGVPVRAGSRSPERLAERVTATTEAVHADVGDPGSLSAALAGCGAAYYLVHSLEQTGDFGDVERRGAEHFARAAETAGLDRIVYLGGIVPEGDLSEHLASRVEVGEVLRGGAVPTLELRASIVIGAGSLSFEAIRTVAGLGPVVPLPPWVTTMSQPIAVDDLLLYLRAALDVPLPASRVVEVGGADRVPYLDVLEETARQSGLGTRFVTAPVALPVPLPSSVVPEWVAGLAPEQARATVKLVESLRYETVVRDDAATELFPEVRPVGLADAVERALVEAA